MRLALIVGLGSLFTACATPVPRTMDAPTETPPDQQRHYTIWLGGAQVGTADETEVWSRAGVVLRRVETLRFLRGDAPVALATTIEVAANHALVALEKLVGDGGAVGIGCALPLHDTPVFARQRYVNLHR